MKLMDLARNATAEAAAIKQLKAISFSADADADAEMLLLLCAWGAN